MKTILILISLLFLLGCEEDQLISAVNSELDTNQGTINIEPPTAPLSFIGLETIDRVKYKSVRLNWTAFPNAAHYLLFKVISGEPQFFRTIPKNRTRINLTKLNPGTQYTLRLRVMDKQGKFDTNERDLTVITAAAPSYANTKSVSFTGTETVSLPASNRLLNKNNKFTVSLWFKTTNDQNDRRLVNFHRVNTAGSALNLLLKNGKVSAGYRNSGDTYKTLDYAVNYSDGLWHHILVVYNNANFKLYFDGEKRNEATDSFIGFGIHPAFIASYDGSGSQYFYSGQIDEVSLFNYNFNTNQINQLYNQGIPDNLWLHPRFGNNRLWLRMGDDPSDSVSEINDQKSGEKGIPTNFTPGSFVLDVP